MSKSYRHAQILKLIRSNPILTQEELGRSLRKLDIHATQVTVSRDIHELGLVKTPRGYREMADLDHPSAEPGGPELSTVAAEFLVDVRAAQNLVVLKTAPGHANTVAVALDHEEWPDVVGTIAGDDTLLVIAPNRVTAERIKKKFLALAKT